MQSINYDINRDGWLAGKNCYIKQTPSTLLAKIALLDARASRSPEFTPLNYPGQAQTSLTKIQQESLSLNDRLAFRLLQGSKELVDAAKKTLNDFQNSFDLTVKDGRHLCGIALGNARFVANPRSEQVTGAQLFISRQFLQFPVMAAKSTMQQLQAMDLLQELVFSYAKLTDSLGQFCQSLKWQPIDKQNSNTVREVNYNLKNFTSLLQLDPAQCKTRMPLSVLRGPAYRWSTACLLDVLVNLQRHLETYFEKHIQKDSALHIRYPASRAVPATVLPPIDENHFIDENQ